MQDDGVAPMLPRGTTAQRFCPTPIMRSVALCGVVSSECRFSAGFGIAALHIIPREEPRRLGGATAAGAAGPRGQTRGETVSPFRRWACVGDGKDGTPRLTEEDAAF